MIHMISSSLDGGGIQISIWVQWLIGVGEENWSFTGYQPSQAWAMTLSNNQKYELLSWTSFPDSIPLWPLCQCLSFYLGDLGKCWANLGQSTTSDFSKVLKWPYLWRVCLLDFPSLGSVPSTKVEPIHEYWLPGSLQTALIPSYILISSTELLLNQCITQDHQASRLVARQLEHWQSALTATRQITAQNMVFQRFWSLEWRKQLTPFL